MLLGCHFPQRIWSGVAIKMRVPISYNQGGGANFTEGSLDILGNLYGGNKFHGLLDVSETVCLLPSAHHGFCQQRNRHSWL